MPDTGYLFIHLPKTAGVSVRNHVENNVGRMYGHYSQKDWQRLIETSDLSMYDCFVGHFNYGIQKLLEKKSSRKLRIFTMLRHPVERVISAYSYHRTSLDWKPCLESGLGLCQEYENDMVKRLSGLAPQDGYDAYGLKKAIPYGSTSKMHLELAKENLSSLDVIGIAEQFNESLAIMNKRFGWYGEAGKRIDHRDKHTYHRPRQEELDKDVLDMIRHYNRLDLELYDYALSLFREQQSFT